MNNIERRVKITAVRQTETYRKFIKTIELNDM